MLPLCNCHGQCVHKEPRRAICFRLYPTLKVPNITTPHSHMMRHCYLNTFLFSIYFSINYLVFDLGYQSLILISIRCIEYGNIWKDKFPSPRQVINLVLLPQITFLRQPLVSICCSKKMFQYLIRDSGIMLNATSY